VASFPSDAAAATVAAELGAATEEVARDWVDAWRAHAEPVDAGGLVVAPAWREVAVPGRTVVAIDPGACFGSGSHPSTRLLLAELAADPPAGLAVGDLGTGSGVLAVAAAVLGAREVVAVDVDPAAEAVVAANAARNSVADRVRASTGSSLPGGLDLVLVNVTAAVQLELAPAVHAAVRPGGHVLLAGLLPGQWRHVAGAYAGWELLAEPELDGWVGARLRAGT
jgi:ribosomal protein L11 methyltransferase